MTAIIYLRCEAPLQAWGLRARWGQRDTASAPTKSGILGMLASASGWSRDDRQIAELGAAVQMAVRVDLPGTQLDDYHTTGGGRFGATEQRSGARYHDEPYIGGVLSAIETRGRIKVKINETTRLPETDVSNRGYLADASFLVGLCGDEPTITQLARAVRHPVWPLFLGRKACVAATPVFAGLDEGDLITRLSVQPPTQRVALAWSAMRGDLALRLIVEDPLADTLHPDVPLDLRRRVFTTRAVRELWCSLPAPYCAVRLDTLEG
jgi:CRISPR system Cascade subunit CasD